MAPIAERVDYNRAPLERCSLNKDPFLQLKVWWQDALNEHISAVDAVHLATVDARGHADGRIVLLKGFDQRGLVFFTNYESAKSKELAQNPHASLTLFWAQLERQIRVRGLVEKTSEEESMAYWSNRPRGAQLAAWASEQSRVIATREVLLNAYKKMEERYVAHEVPCPPHWGGFRLKPVSFEFWQGRPNRLHDRFRYVADAQGWNIERLAP